MKKLISMTDFVLKTSKSKDLMKTPLQKLNGHFIYAKFLKQLLEIWMFVPCDENGNVLEEYQKTEAEIYADENAICRFISKEEFIYKQAKEIVIFEGFELTFHSEGDEEKTTRIRFKKIYITFYDEIIKVDVPNLQSYIKTIEDLIPYNLTLCKPTYN